MAGPAALWTQEGCGAEMSAGWANAGDHRGPGILDAISRRRWVLVFALLVSVVVSVPIALLTPSTFKSRGEVFIPVSDPVSSQLSQVSLIPNKLQSYGSSQLLADTRRNLGSTGSDLESVAITPQRDEGFYEVAIEAKTATAARAGVAAATQGLIREAHDLAQQQISRLQDVIDAHIRHGEVVLTKKMTQRDQARAQVQTLVGRVSSLQATAPGSSELAAASSELSRQRLELARLDDSISMLERQISGFGDQLQSARSVGIAMAASSEVMSPPSQPATALPLRLLSTVGLALAVGLVVAILAILALERRRLVPPSTRLGGEHEPNRMAPPPPSSERGSRGDVAVGPAPAHRSASE